MKLTFLSTDRPLTKTYVKTPEGIDSTPYPLAYEFTSHIEHVGNLEDFYVQLMVHAEAGHCLLKGELQRDIRSESRAGLMASTQTLFLVLDFDGVDLGEKTIDEVLTEIGFARTDYIIQYSASQGIKEGFNAHIFLMLDKPYNPEELKKWLKWRNLSCAFLRNQLRLTKTGMALHWPLDITVAQNDKLIYIAPPKLSGIDDPVSSRVAMIKRGEPKASLAVPLMDVDEDANRMIEQLRRSLGLPDRSFNVKWDKKLDLHVLQNPEEVSITGVKRNGDFTYVNINGGDSWAYYHLTTHPEILQNFKGEPNYKLQELSPNYYREAKLFLRTQKRAAHQPKELNGKPKCWVINKKDESKYYKVEYIPDKGVILSPAHTIKHLSDWCAIKGIPMPEIIEDWELIFDPTTTQIVDYAEHTINTYIPSVYKKNAKKTTEPPPEEYFLLLKHVLGDSDQVVERFVNWLAFIFQTGKKPQTAWLLHGTFGTGKGRLRKIISELFGQQFKITTPEHVQEQFNAYIETAQILWIDEVTTDAWNTHKMNSKLKDWIVGDTVNIRRMRKDSKQVPNFMGIIAAANEFNGVDIEYGDRRWNVALRQEVPLLQMPWATDDVIDDEYGTLYQEENLQTFANYLYSFQVDRSLARTPMVTESKEAVMRATQSLPKDIIQALQHGNVEFFIQFVQPDNGIPNIEASKYKQVVEKIIRGGKVGLKPADIRDIFAYLAGWDQKPGKFNKALAKNGLDLSGKVARIDGRVQAGIVFEFAPTDKDKETWEKAMTTGLKLVKDEEDSAVAH